MSAAFLVHVVLAVLAGGLLTLAPRRLVEVVVAVLLGLGAVLLLRPAKDEPVAQLGATGTGVWTALATSFGLVFVGEFGDVTQLVTANLAARYDDPVSVGVGAAVGLLSAAGLAVRLGGTLVRRVPLSAVRRAAGLLLAVLALLTAAAAVRG